MSGRISNDFVCELCEQVQNRYPEHREERDGGIKFLLQEHEMRLARKMLSGGAFATKDLSYCGLYEQVQNRYPERNEVKSISLFQAKSTIDKKNIILRERSESKDMIDKL